MKRRLAKSVMAGAAATLLLSGWAWADRITTDVGYGADAYVARNTPTQCFGAEPILFIKNAAGVGSVDWDRKAYLRFDISQLGTDPYLSEARLSLMMGTAGEGVPVYGPQVFSVYGLADGDAGEHWVESTTNWNNAPANNLTSGSGVLSNASLLGRFTITGTGTPCAAVDFTSPYLTAFVNADTNHLVTLIVVRDTEDPNYNGWIHDFASREHATLDAPALVVTTARTSVAGTPVPEAVQLSCSPNPLDAGTVVSYSVASSAPVRLEILDASGRCVRRLATEVTPSTAGSIRWDGRDERGQAVRQGVYFCVLEAGSTRTVRKVVALR